MNKRPDNSIRIHWRLRKRERMVKIKKIASPPPLKKCAHLGSQHLVDVITGDCGFQRFAPERDFEWNPHDWLMRGAFAHIVADLARERSFDGPVYPVV